MLYFVCFKNVDIWTRILLLTNDIRYQQTFISSYYFMEWLFHKTSTNCVFAFVFCRVVDKDTSTIDIHFYFICDMSTSWDLFFNDYWFIFRHLCDLMCLVRFRNCEVGCALNDRKKQQQKVSFNEDLKESWEDGGLDLYLLKRAWMINTTA